MCYSIPGKVVEIENGLVSLEYFHEKRKARNDFYEVEIGDYVYAQAGFVVQKIPQEEAQEVLKTWRDFFYKSQEIDLRLTREPKTLYELANNTRRKHLGNSCCVHGLLEFSNYCQNSCLYCGLRIENTKLKRYRMSLGEILETSQYSVKKLGFKALVLQSGEDPYYDEDKLFEIVSEIMASSPVLLILSIGERELSLYKRLFDAGARGVLLRFEMGNSSLYETMRPGRRLEARLDLIRALAEAGFLVMTGFLIGLPGQREEDILNDIHLTASLKPEMFSFGPFIPHPETSLKEKTPPTLDFMLRVIARTRLLYPMSKILVTTAMETLNKQNALKTGLLAGANSLMVNLTPEKYRSLYEIYPNRAGVEGDVEERIQKILNLLQDLGRAPTDLGWRLAST